MALKLAFALVLWSVAARSQNAQISGLIQDPSSLSVLDARVSVRNEQTGGKRITKSNDSGFYSVYSLSPGSYKITIQADGFETTIREGVRLEVGDSARIDFALRIGDARTVVTVSSDTPTVNAENASVGTIISRNLIDQMPLNGRGIQTLIALTPGTVTLPVTARSLGQFSINGQRADTNYFTVDGVSANFGSAVYTPGSLANSVGPLGATFIGQGSTGAIPANNFLGTFSNLVSPDALQEFRIQTSTFAPEFGRSPGGQIGLVTRSGTNQYSGSLFEYLRNDLTDANDWFSNRIGLSKPALRFNNFGGTVGGPIRVPHLYDGRDRTFFFSSFEELLVRQPQAAVDVLVPTLQARSGAPPAIAPLLSAFPLPNHSAADLGLSLPGWGAFSGNPVIKSNQQSFGLRVDQNVAQKLNFFARYNHAPSTRIEPVPLSGINLSINPANFQRYSIQTDMLTLGLTHTLSPNLVNEVRLNGSQQAVKVNSDVSIFNGARRPADSFLFPSGFSSRNGVFNSGFLFASLAVGRLAKYDSRQAQFVDSLSYTRGTHQIKFGLDYRFLSSSIDTPMLTSNFAFTDIYGEGGVYSGIALEEGVVLTRGGVGFDVPAFSAYAQDTWRASHRIAVTYGVRWELNPAPSITKGQFITIQGLSSFPDLSHISRAPLGASLYPTRFVNFAPRIGLAWQIADRPNMQTVLRVGGGLFYDLGQSGFGDFAYQPTSVATYANQRIGLLPSGTPDFSVATSPDSTAAVGAVPTYVLPRTYQWNVTIEQSFAKQTLSASYVAALGRRLIGIANFYSLPIADGSTLYNLQLVGNNSSSDYNSLQLQYNRRLSNRATVVLSYTWSHSIDNLSNDLGSPLEDSLAEYLRPNIDRGPSDFDIRHSLHSAVVVRLPAPRSKVWATPLRNWTVSGIFFGRSAPPTDLYTVDTNAASITVRPNVVPNEPLYIYGADYPGGKRYNPNAFAVPPANVIQGDLGRNALRGFNAWQMDFALHRDVSLSEGVALQLRVEAFNLLNHANFANPASNLSDPQREQFSPYSKNFGLSSATLANGLAAGGTPGELNSLFQIGGPRSFQFALRLRF